MLFPWVPVLMALGIGLWFALPWEPGARAYAAGVAALCGLLALWRWGPELARPVVMALACVLLGGLAAGLRAHLVAAPVLGFRYYGPVEGRIIWIDRSQGDDLRVTLDRVVLDRVSPDRTPATVRISLHGGAQGVAPDPGLTVILTAHLSAPPGPSEPTGFDFSRMAFFQKLGAVGYSRTPLLALAPPDPGTGLVNRLRAHLSNAIMARIPGQAGAFASGAVTGDRSGITQDTVDDLRDSNLSHLLAISGMNMAFLTAFVFALVRYGLALVPPVALRVNTKKVAALVGLGVAAFYLALSGANVATERAFIMVAVMLVAVLADRRALSLRSRGHRRDRAAGAAAGKPAFARFPDELCRDDRADRRFRRAGSWDHAGTGAEMGDAVGHSGTFLGAGGAGDGPAGGGPFQPVHRLRAGGEPDDGAAMGMFIMPGAVVSVLLWPVGLEGLGLWLMETGSRLILFVAQLVAGWDGSVTGIPTPGPLVLPVLTLGVLLAILLRGGPGWRGGAGGGGAGAVGVPARGLPALISADGALVGLMGAEGRVLSASRGARFAAQSWLENDGDLVDQAAAAARAGFADTDAGRGFALGEWRVRHLKGKGAADQLAAACAAADLVILSVEVAEVPDGCLVIDRALLQASGTLALMATAGRVAARAGHGTRGSAVVGARRGCAGCARAAAKGGGGRGGCALSAPVAGGARWGRHGPWRLRHARLWPRRAVAAAPRSVAADQADEATLHLDHMVGKDARLIGRVGRFQRDGAAVAAKALQGSFLIIDQRHDDIAILGGDLFADDDDVAIVDARLDHRIALHLQRVMLATAREHGAGHGDVVRDLADRLDRDAGGDAAHDGDFGSVDGLDRDRGVGLGGLVARDDAGRKAGAFHRFGQLHDLDRAGAVGQAADEAPLFQRRDQAVDAGFRAQIQRLLHLVKGGGHAIHIHAHADEIQQFQLLASQHQRGLRQGVKRVHPLFCPRSRFVSSLSRQSGRYATSSPGCRAPSPSGRISSASASVRMRSRAES
jgi:competence protein ComEC